LSEGEILQPPSALSPTEQLHKILLTILFIYLRCCLKEKGRKRRGGGGGGRGSWDVTTLAANDGQYFESDQLLARH